MTFESLEIMTHLWREGAQDFQGEFWNIGATTSMFDSLGYHLRPYQLPHPPIGIAALTPGSENHKLAGAKGYLPVSLSISLNDRDTAQHWSTVAAAAREAGAASLPIHHTRRTDTRSRSMSYIAFATNAFEQVAAFYGDTLGFPAVAEWDRGRGRDRRFELGGGLRLEILDNVREPYPAKLDVSQRVHVVIEVGDIQTARQQLKVSAPAPVQTSWGAWLFQIHDPDGVPVTFLEWTENRSESA